MSGFSGNDADRGSHPNAAGPICVAVAAEQLMTAGVSLTWHKRLHLRDSTIFASLLGRYSHIHLLRYPFAIDVLLVVWALLASMTAPGF